jgi:hypothetical protein
LNPIIEEIEDKYQEYFDIKEIRLEDALSRHTDGKTLKQINRLLSYDTVSFKTYTLKEEFHILDLPLAFCSILVDENLDYIGDNLHLIMNNEHYLYNEAKKTNIEKDKTIFGLILVNAELKRIIGDNGL